MKRHFLVDFGLKQRERYQLEKEIIEKCANIIADWLINCKVVEKTDKELYSYAVYSVLLSLSPLAIAIGFGICMGCVGQIITIIIPFAIIRKF